MTCWDEGNNKEEWGGTIGGGSKICFYQVERTSWQKKLQRKEIRKKKRKGGAELSLGKLANHSCDSEAGGRCLPLRIQREA